MLETRFRQKNRPQTSTSVRDHGNHGIGRRISVAFGYRINLVCANALRFHSRRPVFPKWFLTKRTPNYKSKNGNSKFSNPPTHQLLNRSMRLLCSLSLQARRNTCEGHAHPSRKSTSVVYFSKIYCLCRNFVNSFVDTTIVTHDTKAAMRNQLSLHEPPHKRGVLSGRTNSACSHMLTHPLCAWDVYHCEASTCLRLRLRHGSCSTIQACLIDECVPRLLTLYE